jgi:cell division protein FtsB
MAEFKKKKKFKFWHSPIVLVTLFLVMIFFVYKIILIYEKERETNKNKIEAEEKIAELTERERILSEDIARLNTIEGVEDIIREKYLVAKEGEKMVIIVEEKKSLEVDVREKKGFWSWFIGIFKNKK